MKGQELYDFLRDERTPWDTKIKAVDADGFVYDVVFTHVDGDTGCLLLTLEIQKKNGEIE